MDIIYACCTLHNFLLSLKDAWLPTKKQRDHIVRDCAAAYERTKASEWAREIVEPQIAQGSTREEFLGRTKRAHIMNEVLRHHPRRNIDKLWWMDQEYRDDPEDEEAFESDFEDDEMDG